MRTRQNLLMSMNDPHLNERELTAKPVGRPAVRLLTPHLHPLTATLAPSAPPSPHPHRHPPHLHPPPPSPPPLPQELLLLIRSLRGRRPWRRRKTWRRRRPSGSTSRTWPWSCRPPRRTSRTPPPRCRAGRSRRKRVAPTPPPSMSRMSAPPQMMSAPPQIESLVDLAAHPLATPPHVGPLPWQAG